MKKRKPNIFKTILTEVLFWIITASLFILYTIKWLLWDLISLFIIGNILHYIFKFYKQIIIVIIIIVIISIFNNKTYNDSLMYQQQNIQLQEMQQQIQDIQNEINTNKEQIEDIQTNLNEYKEQLTQTQNETQEEIDKINNKVKNVSSRSSNSLTESYTQDSVETVETVDNSVDNLQEDAEYITFNVSAYCGCKQCSEGWGTQTASGATPVQGVTIAAGPQYPFGTKIHLEGLGTYIVQDRGGAIKGNKIDIYFNSHSKCNNFGRQYIKGYIVK